ncbi:MAG: dehydrogenase E1 component subunit alpha/beta, partial [Acidobacteriota bacterium]
ILTYYLDPDRTFPGEGFAARRQENRPDPKTLLRRLACQLLGKGEGFSKGIERSYHYGYLAPERHLRHLGMISHLGSMIPVAAGCAFSCQRAGDGVAVNFIGEGGTSTGDFHEALNMAAVWRLPLVLIIENNRYAFSTPSVHQYAAERLSDRGVGYGMAAATVDGNDPAAVAAAIDRAFERARSGGGPTLIEAMVGRMRGHAEGDDSLKVVPSDELERYMAEDPVLAFERDLEASGAVPAERLRRLAERATELVEDAVDYALDAAPPEPEVAHRPALASAPAPRSYSGGGTEEVTYVEAVTQALREEMEDDPTVVVLGQDVGAFEGAFRVTKGLHDRWPSRVLDTPIAESGTLGLAAGSAVLGWRPVVEMQFADFVSCGFNQLVNVLAKLYYRWEQNCPVVVRLPSGGGVGAGAYHSQNPEGWFAHVAGLKVVCPANAQDAYALLRASIRDPNPVIFCEHKFLYRREKGVLGSGLDGELGKARIVRRGSDISLIGYGATTRGCLEAAERLARSGVDAEVVDLRTLVSFDQATVIESVQRTNRALVAYESQLTGGFGAEVSARIAEHAFSWLDAPVVRVAHADRPVPFVKSLEQQLLPTVDRIVEGAEKALRY